MASEVNLSNDTSLGFAKLGEKNYASWSSNVWSYLQKKKAWHYVTGFKQAPKEDSPEYIAWLDESDAAAGIIMSSLEESQKIHVKDEESPVKMWEKLKAVHQQKNAATRFNAYEALFNIQKNDDESLPALCARVEAAMAAIKDVRPEKFTISDLDDDLSSMTLICALPSESFSAFHSALM